jgi:Ser/Thr protein kinase RdoA (MazF antagonist)
MTTAREVSERLALWSNDHELGEELRYSNRASRAWLATVAGADVVVKLTFDGPPYVEPGLRVAQVVEERTGIATGRPLADVEGRLAVPFPGPPGREYSLSVLTYVTGTPVEHFTATTAADAGSLLAVIHRALWSDAPAVPARSLEWFADRGATDERVRHALAAIGPTDEGITFGVLYGDPSPELLRQPDGSFALIDWGTPSFGPLMYDVATWRGHIARHASTVRAADSFLSAYRQHGLPAPLEYELLPGFEALWQTLLTDPRGS